MGDLINRRVIQSRAYHIEQPVPPDTDYDYTYPITLYEAVKKSNVDGDRNLNDEINIIHNMIASKQDLIPPGYEQDIMAYSGKAGVFGGLTRVISFETDVSKRSDIKIPTEKAVGAYIDTKAKQTDLVAHRDDEIRHIRDEERTLWNDMTPTATFTAHNVDAVRHITSEERTKWNAKSDLTDLNLHVNNINNPHKVTAAQLSCYTKTEVDLMLEQKETGFFNDMNLLYDGITHIQIVPYNPTNWNPNFLLEFGADMPPIIDQSTTFIALRASTNYISSASNIVEIWIKRPNLVWVPATPSTALLRNGDLFIRYPDNELFIWIGGKFKKVTTV